MIWEVSGSGARAPKIATVALAIVVVAAVLAGQEFAVRLAMPAFDPTFHLRFEAPRPGIPPLGKAGMQRQINNVGDYDVTVTFNRNGLRDRKDLATSRPEDFFVLGDSFAFGWGVEEDQRFSDVLQARLGRPVFNIATPMNLDDYPKMLSYVASKGANVGRLILAINMVDDFGAGVVPDGSAGTPSAGSTVNFQAAKDFLLKNSALYFMVTSLIHRSHVLKTALIRLGIVNAPQAAAASLFDPETMSAAAAKVESLGRRYDLVVLLIPDSARWSGRNRADAVAFHDRFASELRARGIAVVDMAAVFGKLGDPLGFHFAGDRHWRPKGHAAAAAALAEVLTPR